jgi:hypothetical protein
MASGSGVAEPVMSKSLWRLRIESACRWVMLKLQRAPCNVRHAGCGPDRDGAAHTRVGNGSQGAQRTAGGPGADGHTGAPGYSRRQVQQGPDQQCGLGGGGDREREEKLAMFKAQRRKHKATFAAITPPSALEHTPYGHRALTWADVQRRARCSLFAHVHLQRTGTRSTYAAFCFTCMPDPHGQSSGLILCPF